MKRCETIYPCFKISSINRVSFQAKFWGLWVMQKRVHHVPNWNATNLKRAFVCRTLALQKHEWSQLNEPMLGCPFHLQCECTYSSCSPCDLRFQTASKLVAFLSQQPGWCSCSYRILVGSDWKLFPVTYSSISLPGRMGEKVNIWFLRVAPHRGKRTCTHFLAHCKPM